MWLHNLARIFGHAPAKKEGADKADGAAASVADSRKAIAQVSEAVKRLRPETKRASDEFERTRRALEEISESIRKS